MDINTITWNDFIDGVIIKMIERFNNRKAYCICNVLEFEFQFCDSKLYNQLNFKIHQMQIKFNKVDNYLFEYSRINPKVEIHLQPRISFLKSLKTC